MTRKKRNSKVKYKMPDWLKKSRPNFEDVKPLTPEENARFSMGGNNTPSKPPPVPSVNIEVSDQVAVGWHPDDSAAGQPILRDDSLGAKTAHPSNQPGPGRELVMGLDFGTSSTKVVIADPTLNVGYAVPLVDAVGVNSYLLPSAMIETVDGFYVLAGEGYRHADLKLAMLSDMADETACARVCAFLAVVIRSARAWLYETKAEQYLHADILWKVALGQPSSIEESEKWNFHFQQLAKVAWALAAGIGAIEVKKARQTWLQREQLNFGDELEVQAMPELSAQIHGFVSSSNFDPSHPNIYLMVDIGAGTVDASLFHVKKSAGGAVSFYSFTNKVELLGAANLNRYRVNWWQSKLEDAVRKISIENERHVPSVIAVKHELENLKIFTEYRGYYPKSYLSYVNGVKVNYQNSAKSPDEEFFLKFESQIRGVLLRARNENLLPQHQVKDMPFFLCGGGARHSFYAAIEKEIEETKNCSWLTAKKYALTKPKNIIALGVTIDDYDRLSVAYGLSHLHMGAFKSVPVLEKIPSTQLNDDWISSPTDKSIC